MIESYAGTYQAKTSPNPQWLILYKNGKEVGAYKIGNGGIYRAACHFGV